MYVYIYVVMLYIIYEKIGSIAARLVAARRG